MLDAVTPLLRASVPALRMAAEEIELTRTQARNVLEEPLARLRELGILAEPDLVDRAHDQDTAAGAQRSERSERGRSKRRVVSNG